MWVWSVQGRQGGCMQSSGALTATFTVRHYGGQLHSGGIAGQTGVQVYRCTCVACKLLKTDCQALLKLEGGCQAAVTAAIITQALACQQHTNTNALHL